MAHEDTAIVDAPAPARHDRAVLDIIAGLLKIHGFPEFFDAAAAALARLVGADGAALVVPDGPVVTIPTAGSDRSSSSSGDGSSSDTPSRVVAPKGKDS